MSDTDRSIADADQAGQPVPTVSDDDYADAGGDAPLVTPPADSNPSDSSRVGDREPGDKNDIGSTDTMISSTGGLAGTSR